MVLLSPPGLLPISDLLEILQKVWLNETMQFEWDPRKNAENEVKHGISFFEAQLADPKRVIRIDRKHSIKEKSAIFVLARFTTRY